MKIIALDAATRTGYAFGEAGSKPRTGAVVLKRPADPARTAWTNAGKFLRDLIIVDKPDLIAIEAPMHPAGQKSPDAVVLQWGVVSVCTFVGEAYNIRVEFCNAMTVSKHFVGVGRFAGKDTRKQKKAAFIQRCQLLGYIGQGCKDEDIADACGLFDYASATWGKVRPHELVMFGEEVA